MRCGVCDTRKARRACPALGRTICPVCCGSKRLTEIACPPDCGWLRVAATHPPAAQQRQVEEDQQRLRELLAGLSEPEYVVLTSCLRAALTHRRTAVPSPHDGDLREAAGALRATFETEARGLVYEHRPESLIAARLADALRDALRQLEADGFPRVGLHAIPALRRIERQAVRPGAGSEAATAFFDVLERTLREGPGEARAAHALAAAALAELGRGEPPG
jgi:hypothetical protein